MAKRASTGYSFVVGLDKPPAMTSHDAVNRVRKIYGERRVGHTGTLDPDATGALVVCVGPATRLDQYLTGHKKSYLFTIVFGASTDTDDAQGSVLARMDVPRKLADVSYASQCVQNLVGTHKQLPPAYSAIKLDGKKAYDLARAGKDVQLSPCTIEIYDATLIDVQDDDGTISWSVICSVSAGTYIRSIARDCGKSQGTLAHVGQLRRISCGRVHVQDCVSLEVLEEEPFGHLLDPVQLLGYRVCFADEQYRKALENGASIPARMELFEYDGRSTLQALASCAPAIVPSTQALSEGETVSVVIDNTLKALYRYDARADELRSVCGFATGVQRVGTL